MRKLFFIIIASFTPEGGGPSNRFVGLQCKGLLKAGFNVHVIAAYGAAYDASLLDKNLKVTQISQFYVIKKFPLCIQQFFSYLIWTMFLSWTAIRHRCATWIFCGPALSFAFIIPYTRFLGGKTCYLDTDLSCGVHNPVGKSFPKLVRKIVSKVALAIMARSANHILLGGTDKLVEHFRNIAPHAHISQAWPPTDVALFASGNRARGRKNFRINEETYLVVYSGSVCAREGIHILLKAFAGIVQNVPRSQLFIAGKIPPEGYLPWFDYGVMDFQAMVENLGISKKVIFSGMLEKEDLIDILNAADVLVMPKIDHPYNAVASPIKVGEYLATANPFVSSNICDLDKFFIDGKSILLVKPNNPESLSERILWVYNNKKAAMVIGKEGFKKAVEMFDYSCWVKSLLKAIKFNKYKGKHSYYPITE